VSEWIEWKGGDCPVGRDVDVDLRFRDETPPFYFTAAGGWMWGHNGTPSDIVAYRLHTPAVEAQLAKAGINTDPNTETFGPLGNTDANGEGKQTNPKDMIGAKKAPLSTLPFRVLWRVGLAMLEGMSKYGRHNYRYAGVRASVYFDASMRHIGDWWEGTDTDPGSGLHHIDKAIAGLMVMRDSMLTGNFTDDRPPRATEDFDDLNGRAARIIDLHKDKHPRHFTIADTRETI